MSRRRGQGPFHASVSLGRFAGVEIGINWSWLLVVGLVASSLGAAVFPEEAPGLGELAYGAMAVVATLLFFASLLLHELGHAVVARREGMEIEGITLWLFGGVARFKGMFPSGSTEFRTAIAGPAVSLALGLLFLGAAELIHPPDSARAVVRWLGHMNLILVGFNMLPALPLDGGRVLRSLLWMRSGDLVRATRVAGGLGRAFGNGLVALGAFAVIAGSPGGLWLAAIGFFVAAAARAELAFATMRTALAGLRVRDAMVTTPEAVPSEMTVAAFVNGPFRHTRHAVYPVADDGAVVGLLSFRAAGEIPVREWDQVRVGELVAPAEDTLTFAPADDLAEALTELGGGPSGRGLVVESGKPAGLLSITDVSRLLEVERLRMNDPAESLPAVRATSTQAAGPRAPASP